MELNPHFLYFHQLSILAQVPTLSDLVIHKQQCLMPPFKRGIDTSGKSK